MRCLHGPHAFLQPINQRKVIRGSTKKCLAKMYVRLHKTRQHCAIIRVDNNIGVRQVFTHSDDSAILDEQISAHYGISCIHRYKRATPNEYRLFHCVKVPGMTRQRADYASRRTRCKAIDNQALSYAKTVNLLSVSERFLSREIWRSTSFRRRWQPWRHWPLRLFLDAQTCRASP